MQQIKDASAEKLRGAYYTPPAIASFILHWGINGSNDYDILEPSCGDGVFPLVENKHSFCSLLSQPHFDIHVQFAFVPIRIQHYRTHIPIVLMEQSAQPFPIHLRSLSTSFQNHILSVIIFIESIGAIISTHCIKEVRQYISCHRQRRGRQLIIVIFHFFSSLIPPISDSHLLGR